MVGRPNPGEGSAPGLPDGMRAGRIGRLIRTIEFSPSKDVICMTGSTELRRPRMSPRSTRSHNLAFFLGFIRNPELVGSVIPSSRFLERRIIEVGDVAHARVVVELGPGTGGTTRAILRALPAEGRLLAIEIDPKFADRLRAEADPRLCVFTGSAADIQKALDEHGLAQPDIVFSGIPFSTMPKELGLSILSSVWASLAPGGRFVAYQFRDRVATLGRKLFGRPRIELEALNIPPTRIFTWRKPADEAAAA